MNRPVASFLAGTRYPLRAAGFIMRHASLWPFCIAPLLINIAVVVFFWIWLGELGREWLNQNFPGNGWWSEALRYLMIGIVFVLRLIAVLIAFVAVGNIASVPFNDFLSERTEKLTGGPMPDRPFHFWSFLREVGLLGLQELKRLGIYIPIMAGLMVLSFFPPLTPLTIPAQFAVSAWFLSLEYIAYPLERRGSVMLKQKVNFLRENLPLGLGFGLVMTAMGLVPLVNFFFIPIGVVAGTLLFTDVARGKQTADLEDLRSAAP